MIVYLAVPYSHPDPKIREERFKLVNKKAAELINEGYHVFSPISHSHPIALEGDLPKSWDFWSEYDRAFLKCCEKMFVYKLPGWDVSVGVKGEIEIAEELGIEIIYLEV